MLSGGVSTLLNPLGVFKPKGSGSNADSYASSNAQSLGGGINLGPIGFGGGISSSSATASANSGSVGGGGGGSSASAKADAQANGYGGYGGYGGSNANAQASANSNAQGKYSFNIMCVRVCFVRDLRKNQAIKFETDFL